MTICEYALIYFAAFLALFALAVFCRRYQVTVLVVWLMRQPDEHAAEPDQVNSGLRHQGSKPSHEIQWIKDRMGSAVSILALNAGIIPTPGHQIDATTATRWHDGLTTTCYQQHLHMLKRVIVEQEKPGQQNPDN